MQTLFFVIVGSVVISSFHQTDYKFIIERIEIIYFDKNYVSEAEIKRVHVSRYVTKFILSTCTNKDLDLKDIDERIEGRKFQSNEYRLFPFNYTQNSCKAIKYPLFGDYLSKFNCSLHSHGRSCYIKTGCYSCTNITFDDSTFPPFAPRGKYKLTCYVIYKRRKTVGVSEMFIEIKPTNPLERTIGV